MRKLRLSKEKPARLLEYFVSGSTARIAVALVGVNKNTAGFYFHRVREVITRAIGAERPLAGEIEVDESYFGGCGIGKRRRGGKSANLWNSQAWGPGL